jgi:hypothetical protein
MSPPGYPSARLLTSRAGFRFTRPDQFNAAVGESPVCCLRSLLMSPLRCSYLNGRALHFELRQDISTGTHSPMSVFVECPESLPLCHFASLSNSSHNNGKPTNRQGDRELRGDQPIMGWRTHCLSCMQHVKAPHSEHGERTVAMRRLGRIHVPQCMRHPRKKGLNFKRESTRSCRSFQSTLRYHRGVELPRQWSCRMSLNRRIGVQFPHVREG